MNTILKMAVRNIGRNRRRSILTATAVAAVVIVLIFVHSYFTGMLGTIIDLTSRFTTGHLKIYPKGYYDKELLMPLELAILDSESVERALSEVEGVTRLSRRIKFFTMVQYGDRDEFPVLMGIEPQVEKSILELDRNLHVGSYFSGNPREVLIGFGLAKKLGVVKELTDRYEPGQAKLQLMAPRGIPMTFSIAGIFRFGYNLMDDNMIFVPFSDAQFAADFDADDMTTEILVFLDGKDKSLALVGPVTRAAASVAGENEIEVIPWQAQGFVYQAVQSGYAVFAAALMILFFIAGSTIVNTMLMAVMERTREIGMLKSLGMKSREIVTMFVCEALTIGVAGGVAGLVLGVALAMVLTRTGIPLGDVTANFPVPMGDRLVVTFVWYSAPVAFVFGVLMSLLASLWPAFKAAKLPPAKALRTI